MTVLDVIALLFAAGAGLMAYGLFAVYQQRARMRRVATFVGVPVELPARSAVARGRIGRLRDLPLVVNTAPSLVRTILLVCVIAGVTLGLIAGAALGFGIAAVAALVQVALASRTRSRSQIEGQAPAAVRLLASGLRAGFSMPQALELVARECPEPSASEFARAAHEIEVGASLEEALSRLADRTSPDYALVSTIVSVQHEVGGNLAQALDTVGETLRERFELRQQVTALTAQQRLSSLVLTVLPIALFLYTLVTNRAYLDPLFANVFGRLLLIVAGGLLVLGWMVMQSMGKIEE
jgi:tight adherence protein B